MLTYCHNVARQHVIYVRSAKPLSAGTHLVEYGFDYDGGGLGCGGNGTLVIDGEVVAVQGLERTVAYMFPIGEDFNVGIDPITPVSDEYAVGTNEFEGVINRVETVLGEGEGVSEADAIRMALATQ